MNHLSILTPKIFDFNECLWFLHRNFDECLYTVGTDYVRRAIRLPKRMVLVSISCQESSLQVEIHDKAVTKDEEILIRNYIVDWFGLNQDLDDFYEKLKRQPNLAYMAEQYWGLRLLGIPDMFESICWCIIGQQINLTFAYQMKRRLVESYGQFIEKEEKQHWLFPTPEEITKSNPKDLRAMQYSRQKIEYLKIAAEAFESGQLNKSKCLNLENRDDRLRYLQSIKGIGPWTANYVLMKCLRDTRAIPYGDAGLFAALEKHQLIKNRKDRKSMDKLFNQFVDFESYLVLYLWRSLAPRHQA